MPQYQVSHTSVPGALEAASAGVPPVMYHPRNPYASAAYVTGGNGVSPLIGYPSQYPHVIHYTPNPYDMSIYEPVPRQRTVVVVEEPRSRISTMPSNRGNGAPTRRKEDPPAVQSSPGVYNGNIRVGDDMKLSTVSNQTPQTPAAPPAAPSDGSEVYGLHRTNSMNPNGMIPLNILEDARNLYRVRTQGNASSAQSGTRPEVSGSLSDSPNVRRNSDGTVSGTLSTQPPATSARPAAQPATPVRSVVRPEVSGRLDGPIIRSSAYWDTLGAQNAARRGMGLNEISGPVRSNVPAGLTTSQEMTNALNQALAVATRPTEYDDILPPEVRREAIEVPAPAPYQPRDILPPEVRRDVIMAPSRAPIGQSNGDIPAPTYTDDQGLAQENPVTITPLTMASPVPATIYANNPEWFMPTETRERYANTEIVQDPIVADLPFGIGNAAQFYYNTLRPGYQREVVPVLDAAGDTLSAAATVGRDVISQLYTAADNRLNQYWAQFFYNRFAQRGAMEGQNLNDYLQQAQNLGFYDEALQLLGR